MGALRLIGASLIVLSLTAGCSVTAKVDNPRQVWCDHNQPRRPSLAVVNVMTRPELDDMNTFNGQGAQWCGWKPTGIGK